MQNKEQSSTSSPSQEHRSNIVNSLPVVRTFFLFFSFFLIIQNVQAVAVTPARFELDYAPGRAEELSLQVSDVDNLEATASGEGIEGLSPFTIKKDGRVNSVSATFVFPANLAPGPHELSLLFTEKASNSRMLSVQARIHIPVRFIVPFDGKYLNVQTVEWNKRVMKGEPLVFAAHIKNFGKTTIETVQGTLTITSDADTKKTYAVPFTPQKNLEYNQEGEVRATWDPPAEASLGPYTITPKIAYDDIPLTLLQYYITYGDLFVDVAGFDSSKLYAGQISSAFVKAKSFWGKEIPVEATVDFVDIIGTTVLSVKSPTTRIKSFSEQDLLVYIDASNLQTGTYYAKIKVSYEGHETEKKYEVTLQQPPPKTATEESPSKDSATKKSAVSLLGIALLILAALLFAYSRYRKK